MFGWLLSAKRSEITMLFCKMYTHSGSRSRRENLWRVKSLRNSWSFTTLKLKVCLWLRDDQPQVVLSRVKGKNRVFCVLKWYRVKMRARAKKTFSLENAVVLILQHFYLIFTKNHLTKRENRHGRFKFSHTTVTISTTSSFFHFFSNFLVRKLSMVEALLVLNFYKFKTLFILLTLVNWFQVS